MTSSSRAGQVGQALRLLQAGDAAERDAAYEVNGLHRAGAELGDEEAPVLDVDGHMIDPAAPPLSSMVFSSTSGAFGSG